MLNAPIVLVSIFWLLGAMIFWSIDNIPQWRKYWINKLHLPWDSKLFMVLAYECLVMLIAMWVGIYISLKLLL